MLNAIAEVCVDSIDAALNAQRGAASRAELCDNLAEGGTTPGYGTVFIAREQLEIDLESLNLK